MATWHQSRAGLAGLYAPHPVEWKVVVDKPNELAYAQCYAFESDARRFAERTGGRVIAPAPARAPGTFAALAIGQTFDWISPDGPNSFFEPCQKISPRRYRSLTTNMSYRVGSIWARVYHVGAFKPDGAPV